MGTQLAMQYTFACWHEHICTKFLCKIVAKIVANYIALNHNIIVIYALDIDKHEVHSAWSRAVRNSVADRGPRDYLDVSLLDIFGKFVQIRNFKK